MLFLDLESQESGRKGLTEGSVWRVGTGTGCKGPAATASVLGPSRTWGQNPTEPSAKEPPAFASVSLHRLCSQGLHLLVLLALSPLPNVIPHHHLQLRSGGVIQASSAGQLGSFNRATGPKPQPPWLGIGSSFPLNKIRSLTSPPQGSLPGSLQSQGPWAGQVSTEH